MLFSALPQFLVIYKPRNTHLGAGVVSYRKCIGALQVYFDCLFDDEEIAKRLKKKAIARKNEQKLEEDKKFRRDNNTPNKKI